MPERRSLYQTTDVPTVPPEWVTVDGLLPYSAYTVQVNASNAAGYILSHVEDVQMLT